METMKLYWVVKDSVLGDPTPVSGPHHTWESAYEWRAEYERSIPYFIVVQTIEVNY